MTCLSMIDIAATLLKLAWSPLAADLDSSLLAALAKPIGAMPAAA